MVEGRDWNIERAIRIFIRLVCSWSDEVYASADHVLLIERIPEAEHAQERKKAKPRLLRSHAIVGLPGEGLVRGKTLDVSASGLNILTASKLERGRGCRVLFALSLGARKIAIDSLCAVTNCVFVAGGFRVSMRFFVVDPHERKALEGFLGEPLSNSLHHPLDEDDVERSDWATASYPKTVRISDLGTLGLGRQQELQTS